MIKQFKYKNITWVDIENPTKEEIEEITQKYNIHSLVSHELMSPSLRSRVDLYEDYIYLILHFPTCRTCLGPGPENDVDTEEVDFIIGKDFMITTHYKPVLVLEEFSKIFEANFGPEKKNKEIHAGYLFFHATSQLYQNLETSLEIINLELKKAEKNVFANKEQEMVMVLSRINRDLLDFRWSIKAHKDVLLSLELAGKEFFGDKFIFHLRALTGEYERIWSMLENNKETFEDVRQTNESLLNIKTNHIMKVLTVVSFIFLPLTLLTQVFGMSTDYIPLMNNPAGFWIVILVLIILIPPMYWLAKYKKWL